MWGARHLSNVGMLAAAALPSPACYAPLELHMGREPVCLPGAMPRATFLLQDRRGSARLACAQPLPSARAPAIPGLVSLHARVAMGITSHSPAMPGITYTTVLLVAARCFVRLHYALRGTAADVRALTLKLATAAVEKANWAHPAVRCEACGAEELLPLREDYPRAQRVKVGIPSGMWRASCRAQCAPSADMHVDRRSASLLVRVATPPCSRHRHPCVKRHWVLHKTKL